MINIVISSDELIHFTSFNVNKTLHFIFSRLQRYFYFHFYLEMQHEAETVVSTTKIILEYPFFFSSRVTRTTVAPFS